MATKVDLPDLPARDADAQTRLDFANRALHRFDQRIARVRKYGNVAPMVVLVMENRDELALTASQHRQGAGLPGALADYDGGVCPNYSQPQLRTIYAALIRASDLWELDNARDELLGDLNALLVQWLTCNDHAPLHHPAHDYEGALYRAISDFQDVNRRRTGHPNDMPPVPLFWRNHADYNDRVTDELWLPCAALNTYLRAVRSPTTGVQLHNTLRWFGWQQRRLQARNRGDWRRRVHSRAWIVPVPWDDAELDLPAILEATSNA